MNSKAFKTGAAVFALSVSASFALAQKPSSTLYALHSPPNGACPGLDWHITVTGNNIEGFVAAARSTRIWRLEGTIQPVSSGKERSFEMEADEVGGTKRKAMIKGTSGGEYINATITGAGTACDGKAVEIPRALNGVEGGGG